MDRISQSLLDEFTSEQGLSSIPEDTRFEHLAAFLTTSRHYSETFNTSELVTGAGGDTGIDAIAVIVNGTLVSDAEEIRDLVETNGYVEAAFVFVQAERSSSFDASKIGVFGFGVKDFFDDRPKLPRNASIKNAALLMSAIFQNSSKFKRGRPDCRLYYVTTGKWVGDKTLEARRDSAVEDLRSLGLFKDVSFEPIDAAGIQRLYNQAKNALTREFTFAHKAVVPDMPGVKEAYLGLVPAKEFLMLLDDGSGGMLKSLFYDNVRDWQDYNPVNTEIRETLQSPSGRARFALMNNGVTIIARDVRATGNKILLEDYQVVNGCQSSHVLFQQRALLDDSVYVPLRLIATTDDDVVASIVKATNRQTEVKKEQLIALSDFQKRLEAFFGSFEPAKRLYYERRSRQYAASSGIEKTRVITLAALIRAYASMFLMEPHRATRSYGRLLDRVGKDIFGAEHRHEPYYLAASALYRLEFLFRGGTIDPKYKAARYQILMAARMLANPEDPGLPNSHAVARYAEDISTTMWTQADAEALFRRAIALVDSVSAGLLDGDRVRTEQFTEKLRVAAEKPPPIPTVPLTQP